MCEIHSWGLFIHNIQNIKLLVKKNYFEKFRKMGNCLEDASGKMSDFSVHA